jgi:type II secretory pathway pseudopilin PulG
MRKTNGFTLTEILIVIGLIVLILLLAMPALNFITGSRSIDGAQNQLSAVIGRARSMAIGLQEPHGVMLYKTADGTTELVIVTARQPRDLGTTASIYLDLASDIDPTRLPPGITIQMIDDAQLSGSVRTDDGYTGLNDVGGGTAVGGMILFDGFGKIMHADYGFLTRKWVVLVPGNPPVQVTSEMGELLNINTGTGDPDFLDPPNSTGDTFSSLGFVLAESAPLTSQFGDFASDPQIMGGGYPTAEQEEEAWLDANAVPFLINRYNGTLVRGE